jgi:hypothetical protein
VITDTNKCRDCRGTGSETDGEPCGMCYGTGFDKTGAGELNLSADKTPGQGSSGSTLPPCPSCGGTGAAPPTPPRSFYASFLEPPDDYEPDLRECEDCLGTGVHPDIPYEVAAGDVPAHVELFLTRVADLLESSSPRMAQAIREVAKGRAA